MPPPQEKINGSLTEGLVLDKKAACWGALSSGTRRIPLKAASVPSKRRREVTFQARTGRSLAAGEILRKLDFPERSLPQAAPHGHLASPDHVESGQLQSKEE